MLGVITQGKKMGSGGYQIYASEQGRLIQSILNLDLFLLASHISWRGSTLGLNLHHTPTPATIQFRLLERVPAWKTTLTQCRAKR